MHCFRIEKHNKFVETIFSTFEYESETFNIISYIGYDMFFPGQGTEPRQGSFPYSQTGLLAKLHY